MSQIENDTPRNPVKKFGATNPKLRIFVIIYSIILCYLVTGLAWVQIFQSSNYEEKGERQSLRRILHPGPRGDIYDRNGKLLVGNRPLFSVVVYPNELRKEIKQHYYDKVRTAREVSQKENPDKKIKINSSQLELEARSEVLQNYLNDVNEIIDREILVDKKAIRRHFSQRFRFLLPFTLIDDLTPEEYAALIEQLPVTHPIQIYTDSARFYPYHSAAAHTLGYVARTVTKPEDLDEENLLGKGLRTFSYAGKEGRSGIERKFDDLLGGKTGGSIWRVDRLGYQYKVEKKLDPIRGESITTTLDIDLQRVAENAIGDRTGAAVAIDIQTGEVLVLASKPDYDVNDLSPFISHKVYKSIEEQGAWLNRAIQGRYPPASTFKTITAIAAMRNKDLNPDTQFECQSFFRVGGRNFPEHGRLSFGMVDLPKALQVSSNVYFYQIGLIAGINHISNEARRYGLGTRTGIELPAENAGLVADPSWKMKRLYEPWVDGDTANISIGQGDLLTTPMQMACFTASLARRQTKTIPTLIHKENRTRVNHGGEAIGLSDKQYNTLIEGMKRVTKPGGTARILGMPGITVAAKTGTAEFPSRGKMLDAAWTIAFAPVENPKIAVAVMIEGVDLGDNYYGGKTAAPVVRSILDQYFQDNKTITSLIH